MAFLRIRFWQKVLGALLCVGIVPVALVSMVSIQTTRQDLTSLGVTNILQRSTSTAGAIDAYLQSRLGDIVLVGKLPDIVRFGQNLKDPAAKAAARVALSAAAARSPEYESVAVVDPDGNITAASILTDEGTSVKFREYFTTAFKGTPYISDPSYSVITNKPALFFSAPVKDGDKVLAVVRTRVNMAAIWDVVEGDLGAVGGGAHGFLVDDYGIRLAVSETKGHRDLAESLIYKPIAPIDDETVKKLVADKRFGLKTPEQLVIDPLPTLKTVLDKLPRGITTSSQFSYGAASAEQRGVVTRLTAKPWAYILAVPIATYTKAADDATLNAMSMVIVGLLRRLVGEATMVSTGDVDLRYARFDTRSGDDITREVASAFDRMLNALRFYALSDDATTGED